MGLTISNLEFGFTEQALFRNVNVTLANGQSLCVNTSVLDGVSSLLKCVAGIFQPNRGNVHVDDQDIHKLTDSERIRKVIYCYEHGGLISTFTVRNNILFPIQYHGLMRERNAKQRLLEIANMLDITHLLDKEPYQLNDVNKRLVNVLRALCIAPKLILLDEVQAGMSQEFIDRLIGVLLHYQRQWGFAMVMATTAGDTTSFADQIAWIKDGIIEVTK